MIGALLEVELSKICTTPARANDSEVKIVKTPGARDAFWGWKCVSRGRRRDFDTLQKYVAGAGVRQGRKNVGRRGGFEEGLKRCVSRGRRRDFVVCDVDVWSIRRWNRGRVANFMSRKCYFAVIISRGSYRTSYASAQLFRGRRSTFEASTWKSLKRIGILRSSVCSTCQFWRKSRRNASFLIFKASFSQKCFVFELQSFNFGGSLAEKFRFWASQVQFWRKSRRKLSFLSFKVSFLKEVSQKCFGSLAQKLRFWASKVFLEEVSQKSFVWQNHLNHTSVDSQITWTSNHLTSKSLESQINWQPHHLKFKSTDNQNHLKHTSIDAQISWISNQLTAKSIESQISWQPKSFESQIRWQPNHLTLNSFEADINWLSNHLHSAHPFPIGSLSLETSATALCGRYVTSLYTLLLNAKGLRTKMTIISYN